MKKFLALVFVLGMSLSVLGCGDTKKPAAPAKPAAGAADAKKDDAAKKEEPKKDEKPAAPKAE